MTSLRLGAHDIDNQASAYHLRCMTGRVGLTPSWRAYILVRHGQPYRWPWRDLTARTSAPIVTVTVVWNQPLVTTETGKVPFMIRPKSELGQSFVMIKNFMYSCLCKRWHSVLPSNLRLSDSTPLSRSTEDGLAAVSGFPSLFVVCRDGERGQIIDESHYKTDFRPPPAQLKQHF
jgi:hypothetical protein